MPNIKKPIYYTSAKSFLINLSIKLVLVGVLLHTACVSIRELPGPTPSLIIPSDTIPPSRTPNSTETPTAIIVKITQDPIELTPSPTPITSYKPQDNRVAILLPPGARYVVVGDSLSYGSTMMGLDLYDDICKDRWPYVEKLHIETNILSTASLDRGDSMKTPFWSSRSPMGKIIYYCKPEEGTPLLNTAVAGSNTTEWVEDLRYYDTLITALEEPDNKVVLFLIGADIFAAKIGKPAIDSDQYEQNIGELIHYLVGFNKVVYLALIPYVRDGTFFREGEIEIINATIDEFNRRLEKLIDENGYFNRAIEQWVSFGENIIYQDNYQLRINALQNGPKLDIISTSIPDEFYAKDGLHFHPEGYDMIGMAWAEALRQAIPVNFAQATP